MIRVVLDANVFKKALFDGHRYAQQLLFLARDGRIILLMSIPIQFEIQALIRALLKISGRPPSAGAGALGTLGELFRIAEWVSSPSVYHGCSHAEDNKYFDLALAGKASYLVSEDTDVTGTRDFPVPIVSPHNLLQREPGLRTSARRQRTTANTL